jgi:transglutaminase-like putative cysteine protease
MRISIDHRTTYRFTSPQARVVQLLRMTPENTDDQTVAAWHIAVDCDARMTQHRDGFGNCTTMLYAEGPLERIEVAVSGEMVTSRSDGIQRGATEPLPPRVFLRDTPMTLADEAVADFAREAAAGDDMAALLRLNDAIHAHAAIDRGRPEPGLAAADAFSRTSATSRDLAQIFIAAARSLGVPSRYVTGYCDLEGDHRPTAHGWADAWVDGVGWAGFDPTLGTHSGEHHVRVAVALDAFGAAPVAGTRLGDGREALDVDVTVQRED